MKTIFSNIRLLQTTLLLAVVSMLGACATPDYYGGGVQANTAGGYYGYYGSAYGPYYYDPYYYGPYYYGPYYNRDHYDGDGHHHTQINANARADTRANARVNAEANLNQTSDQTSRAVNQATARVRPPAIRAPRPGNIGRGLGGGGLGGIGGGGGGLLGR